MSSIRDQANRLNETGNLMRGPVLWIMILSVIASKVSGAPPMHTFRIGQDDFLLDDKRLQIRCGEMHAPRVPREYWRHRLKLLKAMGMNAVCAYLFWNMHEPI